MSLSASPNAKSNFAEYSMSRFPALEQHLQLGSKGLKLVSTYLSTVQKGLEKFRNASAKAADPLIQYVQLNKTADDSLFHAMKIAVKGVDEYSAAMAKTCAKYAIDVVEPLKAFSENYNQRNKGFFKDADRIMETLNTNKAKVMKAKEKYGKCERNLAEDNPQTKSLREKAMTEAKEEYQVLVGSHNALLLKRQAEYRKLLEAVEQNERARIGLMAKSLAALFAFSDQLLGDCSTLSVKMKQSFEAVSPASDITLFIADLTRQKQTETFSKLVFEDRGDVYQQLAALSAKKPGSDIMASPKIDKLEPDPQLHQSSLEFALEGGDEDFVRTVAGGLLKNKEIGHKEKVHVLELFSAQEYRHLFAQEISQIVMDNKYRIPNFAVFETLGEMLNSLLTMFSFHNDNDSFTLWTVMSTSFLVYSTRPGEGGKDTAVPLRELISDNSIWHSKDYWISIIQYRVGRSLSKANISTLPTDKDKTLVSSTSKESLIRKSLVFADLCVITIQMALMAVDRDMGRCLLIQFASYYGVDTAKLNQLLSDFEGAQSLPRDEKLTGKEVKGILVARAGKVAGKFAGKKSRSPAVMLWLALDYFGDLRSLANLLCLNKELNELLKRKVHKAALKLPSLSPTQRLELWKQGLCDPSLVGDYSKLKELKLAPYLLAKTPAAEVIKLDVIRSFHSRSEAAQESIMNVLRCYAIYNPEIEYCQGMNFVAGLFYLFSNDEAQAFSMFASLIATKQLAGFYMERVPLLSSHIYVMNRLLAIYLPALHIHLYEEGISAMYFCSSWFLTSFTYVLQYTDDATLPPLLLSFFDKYIHGGHKVLFQTALFVLDYFEDKLMNMKYEQLVQFLNDVSKTGFFRDPEVVKAYGRRLGKFNLSKELLGRLGDEYRKVDESSEKYINLMCSSKGGEFKHYIKVDGRWVAVYFSI